MWEFAQSLEEELYCSDSQSQGDLKSVSNWWPLTISSIFVRMFYMIFARRLSDGYPSCHFQHAFNPVDGITTSVFTILTLLPRYHCMRRSLYIVSLDVSKAFDSITHCSIQHRMRPWISIPL